MSPETNNSRPHFNIGDQVRVLGPDATNKGKSGIVVDVIGPGPDLVYRYWVRLAGEEGASKFFGFELEKDARTSAA
jgi:hypothetical protein